MLICRPAVGSLTGARMPTVERDTFRRDVCGTHGTVNAMACSGARRQVLGRLGGCFDRVESVVNASSEVAFAVVPAEAFLDNHLADAAHGLGDAVGLGQGRLVAVAVGVIGPNDRSGEGFGATDRESLV
jgi:hypothetical protein